MVNRNFCVMADRLSSPAQHRAPSDLGTELGELFQWRPPEREFADDRSTVALIGFRGGRAEGEDRGARRLRMGVPVSRGAVYAHADPGEPALADRRPEV